MAENTPPDLKFYTVEEAARILRLGTFQVLNLCRDGKLPASRPGQKWLISEKGIRDYVAAGHNQPAEAS